MGIKTPRQKLATFHITQRNNSLLRSLFGREQKTLILISHLEKILSLAGNQFYRIGHIILGFTQRNASHFVNIFFLVYNLGMERDTVLIMTWLSVQCQYL